MVLDAPPAVASARLGIVAAGLTAGLLSAGAGAQGLVLTPSLAVTVTATTNRELSSDPVQGDVVTQVSPGLSMVSRRGPVQGTLNYSLNGVAHARESSLNSVYHNLAASGQASGFDGRLGLSANASANRQVVSALGTQGAGLGASNANQTQVFTYGVSPYLNGLLPGGISYRAQLSYNATDARETALGDTRSAATTVRLGGKRGEIGWAFDASRQINEDGEGLRSHNGRLALSLSHQPDIEWQIGARGGMESDDTRTGRSERSWTWGAGIAWLPTPRTVVKLEVDKRFFGRSHLLSLSHRMARMVVSASDSRNFQVGGVAGRSTISNYDLFDRQFQSTEPDPVRRDALVRGFLAANGLDGDALAVTGGFLTAGPTVNRTRNLTTAYQGIRSTLTLSYVLTTTETFGERAAAGGTDQPGRVKQHGLTLAWSHRLSPESSLVVTASSQRSQGEARQPGNDLRSITTSWTSRLGPYTSLSLGVRHVDFDSESNPYTESALFGSLRMRF